MIIDGRALAQELEDHLARAIGAIDGRPPTLAVVVVGEHAPSAVYVGKKSQACERVGITSRRIDLPASLTHRQLAEQIETLNSDDDVDAILVQLPLPDQIDVSDIIETIAPEKDVDGFHPINAGRLLIGDERALVPCTPLGIHYLLQHSGVDVAGKHVVIVGRSNIVGKPLAALLTQKAPGCNATVTVAHSHTQQLEALCQQADILIAATGQPKMITASMVKKGAVVIDVGTSRAADTTRKSGWRLVGDVDFDAVKDKASLITPVPGGVGPLTVGMLLQNTLRCYRLSHPSPSQGGE